MHLKQIRRNGRVYLSIVQSYREGGKVKSKTIETIGYADEYLDRYEDPIAHFREYANELNEKSKASKAPLSLSFDLGSTIKLQGQDSISLGAAIALAHLEALRAKAPLATAEHGSEPNACRALTLFATARMMHAVPKRETWERRASFPAAIPESYEQAYQALGDIARSDQEIVKSMNAAYERIAPDRDTETITFVLGNYRFPTSYETDPSLAFDAAPEAPRYMRLCIALDSDGIPLSYQIVPDQISPEQLSQVLENTKSQFNAKRAVVAARSLPGGAQSMQRLMENDDGFIAFTHPRDFQEGESAWLEDGTGYRNLTGTDFGIKSRLIDREDKAKLRQIAIRMRQQPGKAICITSTETSKSDAAILNSYRELWRIHEPFQIIDADMIAPPFPISAEVHMRAHFAICFAAFFALRLLRKNMRWRFNAAQTANALLQMDGTKLEANWFLFGYRTEVTDAIEETAGIEIAKKIRSRQDVRSIIAKTRSNAEKSKSRHQ